MNTLVVFLACVAAATCNDIQLGSNYGRVIFDQKIEASPAIWRQSQQITINATNQEVISQVVITDQRPEKDGDAKIIDGGEGQKNVTIELKSPTVFRGFEFHVVVYAVEESLTSVRPTIKSNITGDLEDQDDDAVTADAKVSTTTVATDDNKPVVNEAGQPNAPVLTGDQIRNYRNTQKEVIDPIVPYVNKDKTTEVPQSTPFSSKNDPEGTSDSAQKGGFFAHPGLIATDKTINENKTSQYEEENKEQFQVPQVLLSDVSQVKDGVKVQEVFTSSTTPGADVTTATDDETTSTTAGRVQASATHQNFDSISKELGQKVIFGFKKH